MRRVRNLHRQVDAEIRAPSAGVLNRGEIQGLRRQTDDSRPWSPGSTPVGTSAGAPAAATGPAKDCHPDPRSTKTRQAKAAGPLTRMPTARRAAAT